MAFTYFQSQVHSSCVPTRGDRPCPSFSQCSIHPLFFLQNYWLHYDTWSQLYKRWPDFPSYMAPPAPPPSPSWPGSGAASPPPPGIRTPHRASILDVGNALENMFNLDVLPVDSSQFTCSYPKAGLILDGLHALSSMASWWISSWTSWPLTTTPTLPNIVSRWGGTAHSQWLLGKNTLPRFTMIFFFFFLVFKVFFRQSGVTYCCRVCYQWGLPHLVLLLPLTEFKDYSLIL